MKEICEHPWTKKDLPPLVCLSEFIVHQPNNTPNLSPFPPIQRIPTPSPKPSPQPQKHQQQQQQQHHQNLQLPHGKPQHAHHHPQSQRHGMGVMVEEIVRRSLEEYGFEKSVISKCIEAKEFNPVTACHFLLTKRNLKNMLTNDDSQPPVIEATWGDRHRNTLGGVRHEKREK